MDKDLNDNVIDFSKKSVKIEENLHNSIFKGIEYIKITKDENGNSFKEDSLIEFAKRSFYIVTVVKNSGITPALYKYKVPFDVLLDFLNEFKTNPLYGKIIDIERYMPEDLA